MAGMRRKPSGFDPRRFVRTTEGQLVIGFFVLLYVVGGLLIYWFYGVGGMILGLSCITGGLFAFVLLYAIVSLIGWWAGE